MQREDDPLAQFFVRMALLPVMLFFVLMDSRAAGGIGRAIVDFLYVAGNTFIFLLALVSLVFAGVSASGRLKSGPDETTEEKATPLNISPRAFLAAMLYAGLFGWLYWSQAEIGGFSLADNSGFTNTLIFAMPLWTIICIARYKADVRRKEDQSTRFKGDRS